MISVSDVMNRNFYTIPENFTVKQAIDEMAQRNIGLVVIVEDGRIKGVFSERDLMKKIVAKGLSPSKTKVKTVMTDKIITVGPTCDIFQAWEIMSAGHFRHLPIVNDDYEPLGIIGARDILSFLTQNTDKAREFLEGLPSVIQQNVGWFAT